jgi:hypothetical protein
VTAYGLQILDGTAHIHAYAGVMIVVPSIADMWIRITRERPPMSKAYPVCPDCSERGSFSELCHTTQLDLLLCTTCGRVHRIDHIDAASEVSADD